MQPKRKKRLHNWKKKSTWNDSKCCSSCSLNECYMAGRKKVLFETRNQVKYIYGKPQGGFQNVPHTKCLVFLLKMQIPHAPAIHIRFLQIYCKDWKSVFTKFLNTHGPSCYGHVLFFFSSVEFDPFIHSSNFYCLLYTRQEVRYRESSKTKEHQVLCLWGLP